MCQTGGEETDPEGTGKAEAKEGEQGDVAFNVEGEGGVVPVAGVPISRESKAGNKF